MKKFLIIFLIALVVCNFEEENPDILNNSPDKEEEIEEKAKQMAEEAAEKVKEKAKEIEEKSKDFGEAISEKAKEIAEGISEKAKEISKNFMKFFEKLGKDIQEAIIWLKENGYWDEIATLVETIGKHAGINACKSYLPAAQSLCEPVIQFIFETIISYINKITNDIEIIE